MARRFTIDQSRVNRILAAGEAALGVMRELTDAHSEAHSALTHAKSRRDQALRDAPVRNGVYLGEGEHRRFIPDPGQFDAVITLREADLARAVQARTEGAPRREHDMRLANRVRDFVGERSHTRQLKINGERQ